MKRIIEIIFISLILLQVSCSDDFLKPEPLSFFAPENIYVNREGLEAALVTVRKDLKVEFYGPGNTQGAIAGTDEGGCAWLGQWSTVTPSGGGNVAVGLINNIYGYIKNTNVIISRIDEIEWDNQEDRNTILAEALFYRSYWYYRLVHTYGDVPFIGYELTNAKLDFYSHSSWTILDKIQSDMEFAVEWLPEIPKPDRSRPSKYAALHLLAKICLANTNFDKAIEAATEVINGPFALMTGRFGSDKDDQWRNVYWDLHRPWNKALAENTEAIFITLDRDEAPEGAKTIGTYTMRAYICTWWNSRVKDSRGLMGCRTRNPDGSNTAAYDTLGRGNPNVTSTPWFTYHVWTEGGYNYTNTPDLRRADCNWLDKHEFLYNEPTSPDYGKPINPNYFSNLSDTLICLFPAFWAKTYYPHEPTYTLHPMGGRSDWYVFRLAETYLIRAEAYYWKGQQGLAATDINMVRERSNALPVSAGNIDIDYIFDERARELWIEEMRKNEMVRASRIMAKLNKNGYSLENLSENNWYYDRVMSLVHWYTVGDMGYGKFDLSPHNVYHPIYVNVITANTMGVINQNKGYVGAENNVPPLNTIEKEEWEQ